MFSSFTIKARSIFMIMVATGAAIIMASKPP